MTDMLSKRRMAENEVVFREYNERIQKGLDDLNQIAKEDNQEDFIREDNTALLYYCECSDENCRKRIKLIPSRYSQIHKKRDHFVIINGHEIKNIEKVIDREAEFCIVKKLFVPPMPTHGLNITEADNS